VGHHGHRLRQPQIGRTLPPPVREALLALAYLLGALAVFGAAYLYLTGRH
jgi:hypothetical protein